WPAPCWPARTPWGSAPPSWPATRCTAAVSCARASASAGSVTCWRSAPTTSLPSARGPPGPRPGRFPPPPGPPVGPGPGPRGTRHYDWAMLQVTSDDTPGGHDAGRSVLLVRRHRYTSALSYYRCWTPGPVPLSTLIAVASARWQIEEDHQLSKQLAGLDAGQV